jgi:hypothetical protein
MRTGRGATFSSWMILARRQLGFTLSKGELKNENNDGEKIEALRAKSKLSTKMTTMNVLYIR